MMDRYGGGSAKPSAAISGSAHDDTADADRVSDNSSDGDSQSANADSNATASDKPESCVIITGVFSDHRNLKKMETMLDRRGYKVYQEEYGPHTRIGLEFDCSEEDLVEYIQTIRKSVPHARKAWYLKPEMHVDY